MPVPSFASIFAAEDMHSTRYDTLPEIEAQRRDDAPTTTEPHDDPIDIGHLIEAAMK